MLKPNQLVKMRWHNLHKKYYEDKGYMFTKNGDEFLVKAEDLPFGSKAKILVICDYCGKEFSKEYREYAVSPDRVCCSDCRHKKVAETNKEKYGAKSVFGVLEIQNKAKEVRENKYGKGNIAHTPEISKKIKQNNLKKYGVEYVTQVPSIKKKMRESLYEHSNIPTSKIERVVCDMLKEIYGEENCDIGYPLDHINFDCLVRIEDSMIDVEYDGWYWHKNKQEYDKRRNYWVMKQGYKVLRIRSYEQIPTKEEIVEAIDYLVKGNHSLKILELDI